MITVCILTKNAEASLRATLEAARDFPEVVLLDNGSTDGTLPLARQFCNVKVAEAPFSGFGALRNQAARLASNDWIFALDSDEVPAPDLFERLCAVGLDPACAYSLPRHNYYNGKRIRGCGWGNERVVRIYHRKTARFLETFVHESLDLGSVKIVPLPSPLLHTPYRSTADFLRKMEHYSTLFADQHKGKKRSSFGKALRHGAAAFLRSYVLKGGCFSGSEGFTISLYNANTAFYKYLKLAEANSEH